MKNLKVLGSVITGLSFSAMLGGCAERSAVVSTGLVFSGSSQAATVAKNEWPLFNFVFPVAIALPSPLMMDSGSLQVSLNQAWVSMEEIELKAEEVADADETTEVDELKFKGPYAVDLLSANPSPIDSQEIPNIAYKRLKMKLHAVESLPVDGPAALEQNAVYLAGTVSGVEWTYRTSQETEFEISGPNGVSLDVNTNLVVMFKFADLISKIDMSAIVSAEDISETNKVTATNPCPLIHASAVDLYTCFEKGFDQMATFGKDDDGDGELEEDEDSVE